MRRVALMLLWACPALAASVGPTQGRIDAVAEAGGVVVRVPKGEWEMRPLVLRSGVTLELDEGAVLLGSTNVADYAGFDSLISAEGATNVAIVGKGVVDGRGGFFREPKPLPGEAQPTVPMLLKFKRCRDVRIEGITYRQSGAWGLHLMNCDGVTVRGVTCFNHANRQNDGIDIESRNVLIEDCDIDADDDGIVIKSESDKSFPVENVVIRNCRVASTCNFIKFGTGSYGVWRNFLIEDCELRRPKGAWRFNWARGGRVPGVTTHPCGLAGLALELADGGRMEDVTIRRITMTGGVATPLFVRLERRHTAPSGVTSGFRNVIVEGVRMTAPAESRTASSITGVPGLRVSGVTVRDCDLLFPGGGTAAEAADRDIPENEKGYPECFMFGRKALPAFGLYLRHADGISLEGVRLRTVAPDARPAVVREDAPALSAAPFPVKSVLLIGQSNMAGRGEFGEVPPIDNFDRRLLMLRNGRWQPLSEPINVDRGVFGAWHSGVGPGASFARAFADARPGVRVGLIPCADGGTRLDDWVPGGVLYDNAVFQVRQARRTSEVVAILWHQGEGDSDTAERAAAYREKFTAFLSAFRRDAGLEDVPVVVGELGRFLAATKRWKGIPEHFETVNAALRAAADADPLIAFVSSEGLSCKDDEIHFDSKSQREFGRRYAAALLGLMARKQAAAEKSRSGGVCNCAVCPVRQNDFVWENDRFGMRAYGPGEYHKWSGLDVFNKNVATNVCLAWCRDPVYSRYDARPNFHVNLGQGMDNYTMGASRGVGAVAMFADGEWKTYPDWESSRILHTGDDYLEFELVYPAFSAAGKMTYHITLRRGEPFFRNDVSFERMPADFLAGPGLDLEPKRDHAGDLKEGSGFVSLYENPKGEGGKDGSTMVAVFTAPGEAVTPMTDPLNCRVLAFKGRKNFTYWAGADWSLAGRVADAAAWHAQVEHFRKGVK